MSPMLVTLTLLLSAAAPDASPAAALAQHTQVFLEALSPEQRTRAVFDFDDAERFAWFFVPREREGLPLLDMTKPQEALALEVLRTALSASGYEKVATIRKLDDVLRILENDDGNRRNPKKYYFSVFGTPGGDAPWGLRYEGHHASLHWTVVGGKIIASTPQFLGSNPAEVQEGPMQGTRVLGAIEDLGRELVRSLSEAQRAKAVVSATAPRDIVSGIERTAIIGERQGIAYRELTAEQQGLLLTLLREVAGVQRAEIAHDRMDRVRKSDLGAATFAWMGGFERGEGHYFCVHGDTFLVELDNTQNKANHVHLVWRDLGNDFGDDVLRRHYELHADAAHPHDHVH